MYTPVETSELKNKEIISVGRLTKQKQFQLLLLAFCKLIRRHPDWKLKIVGTGPEEAELKLLAKQIGLIDNIIFIPANKNIEIIYKSAAIFVAPSLWEGFPNALSEALAHGVIGIGFSETMGVSNLIFDGYNGFLAKSPRTPEQLYETICRAIDSEPQWRQLSKNARRIR